MMDLAVLTYPNIDPVAIEFGPIAIKWYGLAYMTGLILGWLYIRRLVSTPRLWYGGQAPLTLERVDDLLLYMTIGVIVGILLVVSGFLRITFAWVAMSWGDAILRFLFGLLALVAGIVMIADPALGLRVITIVAIAYLIADGISSIVFATRLPPATGSFWIVLSGLLSIVLGALIWLEWPFPADQAVGILVGVKLIFDGIAMFAVAMTVRAVGNSIQ